MLEDLRSHDIDVRAGTSDDAVDGRVPRLVARPASTEQVAATMRAAHAAGAVTVVRGNGTKLRWGAPAPELDLLLDLGGMQQLLEHQPGDLIVRAEAGMPLADLQEHLRSSGQRLGVDEPVAGTTLGGLIASNASGPRRLHTGTARDLLIGVTIVLADGTIAHSGGKVVKNVAGYDLCKLMTGSFGTLAVVTEATFRLHPTPAASGWATVQVAPDQLEPMLERLCRTQLAPAALEIDAPPGESVTIGTLIEGTVAGVPGRLAAARAEIADHAELRDDLDWPWRYPFSTDGTQSGLKITCRLGAVATLTAAATNLGLHVRGSAGTGVLYAAAPSAAGPADLADALTSLRALAADHGGSVVVLDAPRELRGAVDVWGPVPATAIMRRLKEQFDPARLLAPGRFVGGI
nr:FAD-binding oxidoreductase [Flexivirga meconopsidis]